MRDSKGRFVKGHSVLTSRDPATGKFVIDSKTANKYTVVEQEVDKILAR